MGGKAAGEPGSPEDLGLLDKDDPSKDKDPAERIEDEGEPSEGNFA